MSLSPAGHVGLAMMLAAGCLTPGVPLSATSDNEDAQRAAAPDAMSSTVELPPGSSFAAFLLTAPASDYEIRISSPPEAVAYLGGILYRIADSEIQWSASYLGAPTAGGDFNLLADGGPRLLTVVAHAGRAVNISITLSGQSGLSIVHLESGTADISSYRVLIDEEGNERLLSLGVVLERDEAVNLSSARVGATRVSSHHQARDHALTFTAAFAGAMAGGGRGELTWSRYGETTVGTAFIASPARVFSSVTSETGNGPSSLAFALDTATIAEDTAFDHITHDFDLTSRGWSLRPTVFLPTLPLHDEGAGMCFRNIERRDGCSAS